MPGFAHVIVSLGLSMFLHKVTDGKFSIKHAIIFSVNSLVGPDLFGVLDYQGYVYVFFHGYGWFVAALPLALVWWVFSAYRFSWNPLHVAKRDIVSEPVMTIPEAFCTVSAGGIMHQFVDLIGHPSFIEYAGQQDTPWGAVWFGGDNWFSLQGVLGTGMFPCGNEFGFWEFYAYIIPVTAGSLVLMFFLMQRGTRAFYVSSTIIVIVTFLPLAIAYFIPDTSGFDVNALGVNYFGGDVVPSTYRLTGGEADLGVMVFFGLFFFVPIVLLWMGYAGIPGLKKKGYRAILENVERECRAEKESRLRAIASRAT